MNAPFTDAATDEALDAIAGRRSIRAFLPTPVPPQHVRTILETAARAASGTNMQPWKAHVVTDEARDRVCAAVLAARARGEEHRAEYKYYPDDFPEPYLGRRRKVGWDLYGLLGIRKGDRERMRAQHDRNFTFFGAPVGIFFTIDKVLEIGSWLDYGIFIGNVMTAARMLGLETCPQVAWAAYHRIVRAELGFPEDESLICGLALGYADEEAIENKLHTERAPLDEWVRFHGDGLDG